MVEPRTCTYNASILIVDDNDSVRGAVHSWLAVTFPGLRMQEARDAEEALRVADSTQFDVVLMDIGLPGLNGIEATRQLCARSPGAKIIVVSVHDSDAQRGAALAAGAVAFVPKRRMHEGLSKALCQLVAPRPDPGADRTQGNAD